MPSGFSPQEVYKKLKIKNHTYTIAHLGKLNQLKLGNPDRLPFSIKVLLESAIRNCDNYQITQQDVMNILNWSPRPGGKDISFKPGRVILQDFTGVPCVVDLATMRSAMKNLGGDYHKINPQVQCDLVIDHSVQVDAFGSKNALARNVHMEFKRNKERYEFLKWGQKAFKNFRVVPPATGIVHQINLEYLAKGVLQQKHGEATLAFPDSCVGTDSHTTMINGLGVVGWGVGGIEAEAVMLGEPICMLLPEVVGFKLTGNLKEGVTATDLVLTVTQMLRKKGVVGKFVEFYGNGLMELTLPDRATISNMAPEYGATIGLFPVDEETLRYYRLTGRTPAEVDLVEYYMKEQNMFYAYDAEGPAYSDVVELNLYDVEPSLAGPKRPQDRVAVSHLREEFKRSLTAPVNERGFGVHGESLKSHAIIKNGKSSTLEHGSVVIAAITSCTNTSNPSVLIAAGLLAKNAVQRGLDVKPYVKTSFAPGSQVVEEYIKGSGLLPYLEKLGFHIVGYGCTTCIGNSGPLPEKISQAIKKADLVAVSVLSGNRNFEGRINPDTKASFLASPPLVVAYALTGSVNINLTDEPLGKDKKGRDVYLKDLWPSQEEINAIIAKYVTAKAFHKRYKNVTKGSKEWNAIKETKSDLYAWRKNSTYIQDPPYFVDMEKEPGSTQPIKEARVLVMAGDSITTDHISPAGSIAKDSPAGKYLISLGVEPLDFNSYGSRRGNDRVMTRGTFANIRFRNLLAPGTEGSWTIHFPTKEKMSIYDAAMKYQEEQTPLLVLAGKEYGAGSSRDWAAKGVALLGVKAVIAESYERIHRSNLAGMGVIPLQFKDGESTSSLGLKGDETFDFSDIDDDLKPRQEIEVAAKSPSGPKKKFSAIIRLDTPVEIDYVKNGGILQTVLRKLAQ
ncbi:MAG TPA: aconitate hydratase AcnA [Candidatus Omnitrophota bacterium]|nr:aconitate hydratase AcnA [Candidatus Omnitrophota bacterium]